MRCAGIGNGNDNVGVGGRLDCQLPPDFLAHLVDEAIAKDAVWTGEVDLFKGAKGQFTWRRSLQHFIAVGVQTDNFARLYLMNGFGADGRESATLGSKDMPTFKLAQD